MAKFSVNGLDELALSMSEIAALPDSVLDAMLHAEADVVERAQRATGLAYGIRRTGKTLSSIKRGKSWRTADGKALEVYPQGMVPNGKKNKTTAEVAFINEYGKKGQPARPFIQDANEQAASETTSRAAKVYDNYLKTKGF